MKIFQVTLLLLLICKSSLLLGLDFDLGQSGSCCASETELSCDAPLDHNDGEEKGNCCGSNCDCLCCGHIFTMNKALHLDFQNPILKSERPLVTDFHWTLNLSEGIWQPPRSC